jgi:hypothetical protein
MDASSTASRPIDRNREGQAQREFENLRSIARLFDQAFRVPGTSWRFGIDALFGFVPGLGDIAGGIVAVYALRVARQLGAPASIQLRMLGNIAIDAIVGSVPFFGDLFDFAFKAQTRNLALLEAWRKTPAHTARRSKFALIMMPVAIFLVFAALTALGVFLLVQLYQWVMGTFLVS